MHFFKRILKSAGGSPHTIITDKLRSYGAAQREIGGAWEHDTSQYSNNRCEQSHRPTRSKERTMKMVRSMKQGQRFLNVHAAVSNLFNSGRHLTTAKNYRKFRDNSFSEWDLVVS
jgi:putative transposase